MPGTPGSYMEPASQLRLRGLFGSANVAHVENVMRGDSCRLVEDDCIVKHDRIDTMGHMKKLFFTNKGQWRLWVVAMFSLAIAVFGCIPGVGIPGAIVSIIADAILRLIGADALGYVDVATRSDFNLWGAALLTTIVWPISIVPSYFVAFRLMRMHRRWQQHFAFWALLLLWGLIVTFWINVTNMPPESSSAF